MKYWFILPLLSLLDVILTTYTIKKLCLKQSFQKVQGREVNPLAIVLWKKLGLIKGSIVLGIISVTSFTFLSLKVFIDSIFYIVIGVLLITIIASI